MTDIYQELAALIAEELDVAAMPLRPDTELDSIPGWDSATFAGVLLGIEDKFGVTATRQQIGGIYTAGDLAKLCQS